MRILQIGASFVGAQEKIEYSIHTYLKENKIESYILYSVGNSLDSNIIKYETRIENYVRRFLFKISNKNSHSAIFSTFHLILHILKIKPDLIHLHVLHHGYIDYQVLFEFLCKYKVPVVFTMHDMWAFTGGCYHFNDISCEKYKNICCNCPKTIDELDCSTKDVEKNFRKKMSLYNKINHITFISVSKWVNQQLENTELKKYLHLTIPNAIDCEIYAKNNELDLNHDKFVIIGVASVWTEAKGISNFLKLAKIIGNEYQIILVGDVSENIKNDSPNNIKYVGRICDKDILMKLYAYSNIHISMSKQETFGMTFVEAAYLGIKSIGFDCTAISETIQKVNGYLVQENDLDSMIVLLKYLKEHREECKLDLFQIEKIKNEFSSEIMCEKYLEVYKKNLNYKIK